MAHESWVGLDFHLVRTSLNFLSEYNDVVVFYKVPFALPPVDALRFRAPVMATDWSSFDHSKVYHEFDHFIRDEFTNLFQIIKWVIENSVVVINILSS